MQSRSTELRKRKDVDSEAKPVAMPPRSVDMLSLYRNAVINYATCKEVVDHLSRHQSEMNRLLSHSQILNHLCKEAKSVESVSEILREYIKGAALAINPLPIDRRMLYQRSDIAALYSDTLNAYGDMAAVYDTIAKVHRLIEGETDDAGKRNIAGIEQAVPSGRADSTAKAS